MKIVYIGLHYTNLDPDMGESFECSNFYKALLTMPDAEVIPIWYEGILEKGRARWNEELLEIIKKERPNLFFAFMFTDELDKNTLKEIKKITTSLAWFSDDHWRFYNYSKYYAPHFSRIVTTYSKAVKWYRNAGIPNVIRSQWGVNADLYTRTEWTGTDAPPEVSFVGTWSRPRARLIAKLRRAGIPVTAYGNGWEGGRISNRKMREIFSNSKINLALNPAPAFWNVNSLGRLLFRRLVNRIVPDLHIIRNAKSLLRRGIPQIKARHFEIPACGGFTLTAPADDIGSYFEEDKEMVYYRSENELVKKIRYYLVHPGERQHIAEAGRQRVFKDHGYKKRFREIFEAVGL